MAEEVNIAEPEVKSGPTKPAEEAPNKETTTAPDEGGERPEWLPEKFKTPEELAKAYGELESKQGTPPPEALPSILSRETMKGFAEEVYKEGKLSEKSYKELEAKGISKDLADDYVTGWKAKQEVETSKLQKLAGGKAAYDEMVKWAGENLSDKDITAFNTALSGDMAELAITALKARYVEANGTPPKLVSGNKGGGQSVFESQEQVTAAMRDPRYRTDEAYQKQVQAKLLRSTLS